MGTASYVAEGLGNLEGADRAMGRTAARKSKTSHEVYDEMTALGVALLSGDPGTVAEEAAFATRTSRRSWPPRRPWSGRSAG